MRPRALDEVVGQEHLLARGLGAARARSSRAGRTRWSSTGRRARARRRWRGSSRPRRTPRSRSSAPSRPGGPRCAGARARPAPPPGTAERDGLLPRRDPPLQQGPAGRAAAGGRGGPRHADRGDDREPVLRGQLGAALAHARSTSCARCWPSDVEVAAAARGRRRSAREADDDALAFLAARAGGDARTALAALELAVQTHGRVTLEAPRTRCSGARCRTTRPATATTTRSRPGSRPRAARTPTPPSTTSR